MKKEKKHKKPRPTLKQPKFKAPEDEEILAGPYTRQDLLKKVEHFEKEIES
jgi:hypothetical protein